MTISTSAPSADVELALAQRLAHVAGIHLVAAPVAERRAPSRPPRGTARRTRRRTWPRRRRSASRAAPRGSRATRPSIMSLGQTTSAPASTCETAVRTSSSSDASLSTSSPRSDAAVAVGGVLAEADVGQQQQLGEARPERAQRLLDDPVGDPGARALVVLLLGDAEEDDRPDAGARAAPRTRAPTPSTVRRGERRQALVRAAPRARRRAACTRSSSESVVSRTRSRSAALRRRRRRRVAGKALTPKLRARGVSAAARARSARGWLAASELDGSTLDRDRAAARPALEDDPLGEELPGRAADGEQRQRDQRAEQPVDVRSRRAGRRSRAAGAGAARCPSPWARRRAPRSGGSPRKSSDDPDDRERVHDERVDRGRDRPEPGPEVGQHLGQRDPGAEEQRVGVGVGQQARWRRGSRARSRRSRR